MKKNTLLTAFIAVALGSFAQESIPFTDNFDYTTEEEFFQVWINGDNENTDSKWIYECENYYPIFGNNLLNINHTFTTYKEFQNNREQYFEKYGTENALFIKPNSGEKTFTGMIILLDLFDKDIEFINRYSEVPDDTKIIVSEPYTIHKEYRFIVNQDKIITGSQYKDKSWHMEREIVRGEKSFTFAQSIVSTIKIDYFTDPMWCLDIAELPDGQLKVLEIGCFSCCGFYSCNTMIIARNLRQYIEHK